MLDILLAIALFLFVAIVVPIVAGFVFFCIAHDEENTEDISENLR